MSAESPESDNERLNSIEDRLNELEDRECKRITEERLRDLEENQEADQDTKPEGEGQKALYLALAALLTKDVVVQTVADLPKTINEAVKEHFSSKTKEIETHNRTSLRMFYIGLSFSALLLLALSYLAWHDKITKDVFAGLVGSLIGYWYGREKSK